MKWWNFARGGNKSTPAQRRASLEGERPQLRQTPPPQIQARDMAQSQADVLDLFAQRTAGRFASPNPTLARRAHERSEPLTHPGPCLWTDDGAFLVTPWSGVAAIWHLDSNRFTRLREIAWNYDDQAAICSQQRVAVTTCEQRPQLWDLQASYAKPTAFGEDEARSACFVQGTLYTASRDGVVTGWSVARSQTGLAVQRLTSFVTMQKSPTIVASPAAQRAVTFEKLGTSLRFWDLSSAIASATEIPTTPSQKIQWATFSPDARALVTVSHSPVSTSLWDLSGDVPRLQKHLDGRSASANPFSADGAYLVSAAYADGLSVCETSGRNKSEQLVGATFVETAVFSRDGRCVASSSGDGITVWRFAFGKLDRTHELPFSRFSQVGRALSFSADGRFVVAGARGQGGRIWDLQRAFEGDKALVIPPALQCSSTGLQVDSFDEDLLEILAKQEGVKVPQSPRLREDMINFLNYVSALFASASATQGDVAEEWACALGTVLGRLHEFAIGLELQEPPLRQDIQGAALRQVCFGVLSTVRCRAFTAVRAALDPERRGPALSLSSAQYVNRIVTRLLGCFHEDGSNSVAIAAFCERVITHICLVSPSDSIARIDDGHNILAAHFSYNLGLRLYALQSRAAASIHFKSACDRAPANVAYRLTHERCSQGNDIHAYQPLRAHAAPPDADVYWRRAVDRQPENGEKRYRLGTVLFKQGRYLEAEQNLRKAANSIRHTPELDGALGLSLLRQNQFAAAEPYLKEAAKHAAEATLAYGQLGLCLYEQGQVDASIAAFRSAVRFYPREAPYMDERAYYDAMIPVCDAASTADNADVEFKFALAQCLYNTQAYNDVEAIARELVDDFPANAAFLESLGASLFQQQRYEEAETYLRRTLAVDAKDRHAAQNLAACLDAQGKHAEADACLRAAGSKAASVRNAPVGLPHPTSQVMQLRAPSTKVHDKGKVAVFKDVLGP